MTIKLYDLDSHQQTFQGKVTACREVGGQYHIVLDQTAFFPSGGGQAADGGTLNDIPVIDVSEQGGDVIHCTPAPIPVGTEVLGQIDWDTRFRRMQQHSGEHIVSGLIHQRFGYDNIGFHMGSQAVTIDYSGAITWEELKQIEYLANEAVMKNIPVTAWYPTPKELAAMEYRSKLDLVENIRIVSIAGCDTCACCAPHVAYTGEIGPIKLLDCAPHKGGVRINMLCGFSALEDAVKKYDQVMEISRMLSAKTNETALAVQKLLHQLEDTKQSLAAMERRYAQAKLEALPPTSGDLLLFEPDLGPVTLRELVNAGMERCEGICAVFSGADGAYRYVIGSKSADLKAMAREINQALNGRGGGTAGMIQGSVSSTRHEIEDYFGTKTDGSARA